MTNAWYAVRVRSNFEHTVASFLSSNGYEAFLPTYRQRRQWSDRVKEVAVPLFRGYVFCQMDIQYRQIVVQAPGFLNIVAAGSAFLPVAQPEIDAIRQVVNSPVFLTPWPYLCIGERVVVTRGPLSGVQGILLEQKNQHKLIVSVHLLQRSIAAEVSLDCVRPVNESSMIPVDAARRVLTGQPLISNCAAKVAQVVRQEMEQKYAAHATGCLPPVMSAANGRKRRGIQDLAPGVSVEHCAQLA